MEDVTCARLVRPLARVGECALAFTILLTFASACSQPQPKQVAAEPRPEQPNPPPPPPVLEPGPLPESPTPQVDASLQPKAATAPQAEGPAPAKKPVDDECAKPSKTRKRSNRCELIVDPTYKDEF